jgi:hypothetical protein
MTILQSIEMVTKSATEFVDYQNSIKQYNELNHVLGKFDEMGLSGLRKNEAIQSLLADRGSSVQFPVIEKDKLSELAKGLFEAFDSESTAQSLKTNGLLTNTLRALKKLVSSHQTHLDNAFNDFVRSKYGGINPRDLNLSAAKTPKNTELIQNFKVEYDRFRQAQNVTPITTEVLNDIETIGSNLQEIIKKVDFDVPDEVKNFFNGIENGGADLNLLNETVINYLRENNMIADFKIFKTGVYVGS